MGAPFDISWPLTVGELAGRTGVATSALRFYEERGLIRSKRNASGYRRYARATARRVAFVVFAQRVGFSPLGGHDRGRPRLLRTLRIPGAVLMKTALGLHKVLLEATPAGWEDGSGKMMSLPLFGIPFSSTPVSASMAP